MGKKFFSIFLHVLILALAACNQPARETDAETPPAAMQPLQAPLPGAFYDSLQLALQAYYQLSRALVQADSGQANLAAGLLQQRADSLPLGILPIDSSHREQLKAATGSISAELAGLLGEPGLESKRASFEMVSDMLYDLIKITGLKGSRVYRLHCPMAFNNRGAYWLSDTTAVLNPYYGQDMLHCGDVTDTLIYQ